MAAILPGDASCSRIAGVPKSAAVGFLAAASLQLAACGATAPVRPGAEDPGSVTRSINLSGFPPEFQRGFTDGCTAARAGKVGARPKVGGQYNVGWHDGFDYCSPQKAN